MNKKKILNNDEQSLEAVERERERESLYITFGEAFGKRKVAVVGLTVAVMLLVVCALIILVTSVNQVMENGFGNLKDFPKALESISAISVGTNVEATFTVNESGTAGAVEIYSTTGVGTIDKSSLRSFFDSCGLESIDTITFRNVVNAPVDSSELFRNLSKITSVKSANNLDTSSVTNMASMFNSCTELTTIGDVGSWDVSQVTSMRNMFCDCNALIELNVGSWNVSKVRDMCQIFFQCHSLTRLDASNWDVSNARDMSGMFQGCNSLVTLGDLSNWNIGNVTNFNGTFAQCGKLTTLGDLSNWDTSKVTIMGAMFSDCGKLTTLGDLSNWDVSKVTNMINMFRWCGALRELNVGSWNVSQVRSMYEMFEGCHSLTSLDVSNWDTSSVRDMYRMFSGCSNLSSLDVSKWNVSSVTNIECMFGGCSNLTELDLSNWNMSSVKYDYGGVFENCPKLEKLYLKNLYISNDNIDGLSCVLNLLGANVDIDRGDGWTINDDLTDLSYIFKNRRDEIIDLTKELPPNLDLSKVTKMEGMFDGCTNLKEVIGLNECLNEVNSVTNMRDMFRYCNNLTELDVSQWDTSNVTDMAGMFNACNSLEKLDVSSWNTGNVTLMQTMFRYCTNLTKLDVSQWDTSNVTNMHDLFAGCTKLTTVGDLSGWSMGNVIYMEWMFSTCKNLVTVGDISGWDTRNVISMQGVFNGCNSLTELKVSNWNTSNVTNMANMFADCQSLTEIDVSKFDTGKVTNMANMFRWCSNLISVGDLSGWDTSKVIDMYNMFEGCKNLTELDVSQWDTSNVTNMCYMFNGCKNLTELDVSQWNTSNVTVMFNMFEGCNSLIELDVSQWVTSKVTDMSYMFSGCNNLTELDVSQWNTSNVKTMRSMFAGCKALNNLDVSKFDTSKVINMSYMFNLCTSLKELKVSNWNTSNVTNMDHMFAGCIGVTEIDVGTWKWDTSKVTNMTSIFSGCINLRSVGGLSGWNTSEVTSMANMFNECSNLISVGDLSGWNTSKVINMNSMFRECNALIDLDLSSWNMSNVTNVGKMFINCNMLRRLDLSNWDMSKVENVSEMFVGCEQLEEIYTPKIIPDGVNISIGNGRYNYRDRDNLNTSGKSYTYINNSNTSKYLFRGTVIYFNFGKATDYKLKEIEPISYLRSEISQIDNTLGTEGKGPDLEIPPIEELWDTEQVRNTGYEFAKWSSSYDGRNVSVPYVSRDFLDADVTYTATFYNLNVYNLELTMIKERPDKNLEFDEELQDKFLEGAKYQIRDPETKVIKQENGTNENGKLIFKELDLGKEYNLLEVQAPLGYELDRRVIKFKTLMVEDEISFQVISVTDENGQVIENGEAFIETPISDVSGDMAVVKVKLDNRTLFRLKKVDTNSDTNEPLEGAKFTIWDKNTNDYAKDVTGKYVGIEETVNEEEHRYVVRTDKYGLVTEEVLPGEYVVTEIEAPFGYDLPENPVEELNVTLTQEMKKRSFEEWTAYYPTNAASSPERVLLTSDGGRLFVGSWGGIKNGDEVTSEGGDNVILKFSINNEVVWRADLEAYPNMVLETRNRDILVVDTANVIRFKNKGFSDEYPEYYVYDKTDEVVGNKRRSLGEKIPIISSGSVKFTYMMETDDDGFVVAGLVTSACTVEKIGTTMNNNDVAVIKCKKSGDKYVPVWASSMKSTNDTTTINGMSITENGDIVLMGWTTGSVTLPNGTALTNSNGNRNTILVKYAKRADGTGYDLDWGRMVTGTGGMIHPTGVTITTNNRYVVVGFLTGSIKLAKNAEVAKKLNLDSDLTITRNGSGGNRDQFIIVFDKDGYIEKIKRRGGTGNEQLNHIGATNDGGFVAVGSISSTQSQNPTYDIYGSDGLKISGAKDENSDTQGLKDALVTKYDKDLNIEWEYKYGPKIKEDKDDWFSSVDINSQGKILLGMVFNSKDVVLQNGEDITVMGDKKGADVMLICLEEVVSEPEIIETRDIVFENSKHLYEITTEVEGGVGGTISGQDEKPYETVEYKGTSVKEIAIVPADGYRIESVTINGNPISEADKDELTQDDKAGSMRLKPFTNMSENKHVVVKFVPKETVIENNEVTKTSLTEVMNPEDNTVEYEITYKATIKEGFGDAIVTITDSLPFDIDVTKSVLDGGTYKDSSSTGMATITWREERPDVNTDRDGELSIDITKRIRVVFKDVDYSYSGPKEFTNKVEGKIEIDGKEYKDEDEVVTPIGPSIKAKKTVETKNGTGDVVVEGEELTYTIEVTNSGGQAKIINISDKIPDGTTYVADSVKLERGTLIQSADGDEYDVKSSISYVDEDIKGATIEEETEGMALNTKTNVIDELTTEEIITEIVGKVKLEAKETIRLVFKVTVDELGVDVLGDKITYKKISNVAVVDENPTDEVIVNVNKADIYGWKEVYKGEYTGATDTNDNGAEVEIGDVLTYRIHVKNRGTLAGLATIEDMIPVGTTFVTGSVKLGDNSYADSDLIAGVDGIKLITNEDMDNPEVLKIIAENIEVGAGKEIVLSFKVRVNTDVENGTDIVNTAHVNDSETTVTNKVVRPIVSVEKKIAKITDEVDKTISRLNYVFRGDIITYNIVATNRGDLAGRVVISDVIPGNTEFVAESIQIDGSSRYILDGTEIDLRGKTERDLADGIKVSVPAKAKGENGALGKVELSFQVKVKEKMQDESGAEQIVMGDVINKATWKYDNETEDPGENKEHETDPVKVPIVAIRKEAVVNRMTDEKLPNETVTAGDEIEYAIVVENTGTKAIEEEFVIEDIVPEKTTLKIGTEFPGEYNVENRKITWIISELAVGESKKVGFTVTVDKIYEKETVILNKATVNGKDTNEVETPYKLPPKVDAKIVKDGDKTTVQGNKVHYTIDYTATIDDFKGNAYITIVDKLPCELDDDLSKSELDGGEYDRENGTITWTISVGNIDTYTTKEPYKYILPTKELLLSYKGTLEETFINEAIGTIILKEVNEDGTETEVLRPEPERDDHEVTKKEMIELPQTGGNGTMIFVVAGMMIMVIGATMLVTNGKEE